MEGEEETQTETDKNATKDDIAEDIIEIDWLYIHISLVWNKILAFLKERRSVSHILKIDRRILTLKKKIIG